MNWYNTIVGYICEAVGFYIGYSWAMHKVKLKNEQAQELKKGPK